MSTRIVRLEQPCIGAPICSLRWFPPCSCWVQSEIGRTVTTYFFAGLCSCRRPWSPGSRGSPGRSPRPSSSSSSLSSSTQWCRYIWPGAPGVRSMLSARDSLRRHWSFSANRCRVGRLLVLTEGRPADWIRYTPKGAATPGVPTPAVETSSTSLSGLCILRLLCRRAVRRGRRSRPVVARSVG